MRERSFLTVLVVCALTVTAAIAFAQSREKSSSSGSARYRLTNWPNHTDANKSYVDEVEEHLNKIASEGWRFHSDLVGQNVKMMVFEREK